MTLDQIKATQIIGNAWSDSKLMADIDKFALDPNNSMADRAEALRHMSDAVMGCGREEHLSNAELVQDYIDQC